jgi:hypothetical protein
MSSIPSGCWVEVDVWDIDLNYIVQHTRTNTCWTGTMHVVAPDYHPGYDTYETHTVVDGHSGPWSPPLYLP